jgi:casein kinase II subunit alpha
LVVRGDDGGDGTFFISKIFNREPFFKGADNYDQLEQITKVLGTEELYTYLNKYNIGLEVALERVLGQHRAVKLSTFVNENNKHLATPDALDLLGKMMQYDHDSRPSA